MVTFRAKRFDRLRDKVYARYDSNAPYGDLNAIYEDVVDLAGVRIALYFPGDVDEVSALVESTFKVHRRKPFPQPPLDPTTSRKDYAKIFSGYHAVHYGLRLNADSLHESRRRYADATVELQIGSVLMHAWAEVEHDLVYKPFSGALSRAEHAILDEINGMVLSGEIALRRLQDAVKERAGQEGRRFDNHYELAAYLYGNIRSLLNEGISEPILGRVDILLRFLQRTGRDKPEHLARVLPIIDPRATRPVVNQIVDRLIDGDSKGYEVYAETKAEIGPRSPYAVTSESDRPQIREEAIGYFIARWIQFEAAVRDALVPLKPQAARLTFGTGDWRRTLEEANLFTDRERSEIDAVARLRNDLVHGAVKPEPARLRGAGRFLEELLGAWAHSGSEGHAVAAKAVAALRDRSRVPEPPGFV